jgi:CheY-like chemotaxis protein
MYAAFLTLSGLRVIEAADGGTAVRIAAEAQPDAIVMDLALPGIDGWEATRRLKADARTARIPVIALSGQVLPRHAEEARLAGCAAVLLKPVLPEALVAEVRRLVPPAPSAP